MSLTYLAYSVEGGRMNVNVLEDVGLQSIKVAMAKHRTCGQALPWSAEKALKERRIGSTPSGAVRQRRGLARSYEL